MKSETVNPMPASIAMEAIIFQSERAGIGASPVFTVTHEKAKTPKNLPTTRPIMIARLIPLKNAPALMPQKHMPALANANSGTIR